MKPQVLIVEDSRTMRESLRLLLAGDFECSVAENGEAGLAKMLERPPDLLLSDVNLGGMDGYELCQRLRAEPRLQHIRVVFISGSPPRADAAPSSQPDAYFVKPVKPPELIARLQSLLSVPVLEDALERPESSEG